MWENVIAFFLGLFASLVSVILYECGRRPKLCLCEGNTTEVDPEIRTGS